MIGKRLLKIILFFQVLELCMVQMDRIAHIDILCYIFCAAAWLRVADKYDALVLSIVWANRGFDFYRTIPETAYAVAYLDEFRQTDADPDTGCMEFELCKGRFAFRLTAPYSKERRRVASEAAKKNSVNRIQHCHPGEILRCIHGLSAGVDGNKKSPKHRPARSASG